MSTVKQELIKLGSTYPELQKHLKPILDALQKKVAKKYQLSAYPFGNGMTIKNNLQEGKKALKAVAYIDEDGTITYYEKRLPQKEKRQVEAWATQLRVRFEKKK